ncbi:MAG TPA: rhodanese-related sulfurtransferase [Candidatus Dojkabacteria bacterium]|nr:rhodanese-related sulfurtransferase [Candidatus Dojkabacteria bacterium]
MNNSFKTLLYYKYVDIDDPEQEKQNQQLLCKSLHLKGRIILGKEGINGTVEGLEKDTQKYIEEVHKIPGFEDIWFKVSDSNGEGFPRLSIKVRDEIVTTGIKGLDPRISTGKYLTAGEMHEWIEKGKKFYIVDMRNDYEHKSGYFKDSILVPIHHFRELPSVLPVLESLKGKTIVTVCTGGVRCEKASGFLIQNGFEDVYQLYGGIVTYMEKYPNQDFLGKLYVFDGRVTMGFNTDSQEHVVVGKCEKCGKSSDNYVNCSDLSCHLHFICCKECKAEDKGQPMCNNHN